MAIPRFARRHFLAVGIGAFWLALLQTVPLAGAVEVESLYTVEVNIDPAAPDPQQQAYADALAVVLVRVTGREAAAEDEDLLGLFPNPGRYVLQFLRGENETLVVTLDGPAIESLLRRAGQPVWGSERPLTLVWLAVDRGMGERDIVGSGEGDSPGSLASLDPNREFRERILDAAERRGIPMMFPLMDTEDQSAVSFSDIWGGFDDALLDASSRYGTASILVGRVRSDDMFGNRWSYHYGNQRLNWTGTPETAINLLADALAEQFAYAGNAPAQEVGLTISGIDSVAAFGAIERVLSDVAAIESFRVDTVAGEEIRYRVRVQGGTDRLASALEFSGILLRPDWLGVNDLFADDGRPVTLEYRYQPLDLEVPEDDGAGFDTPDTESF